MQMFYEELSQDLLDIEERELRTFDTTTAEVVRNDRSAVDVAGTHAEGEQGLKDLDKVLNALDVFNQGVDINYESVFRDQSVPRITLAGSPPVRPMVTTASDCLDAPDTNDYTFANKVFIAADFSELVTADNTYGSNLQSGPPPSLQLAPGPHQDPATQGVDGGPLPTQGSTYVAYDQAPARIISGPSQLDQSVPGSPLDDGGCAAMTAPSHATPLTDPEDYFLFDMAPDFSGHIAENNNSLTADILTSSTAPHYEGLPHRSEAVSNHVDHGQAAVINDRGHRQGPLDICPAFDNNSSLDAYILSATSPLQYEVTIQTTASVSNHVGHGHASVNTDLDRGQDPTDTYCLLNGNIEEFLRFPSMQNSAAAQSSPPKYQNSEVLPGALLQPRDDGRCPVHQQRQPVGSLSMVLDSAAAQDAAPTGPEQVGYPAGGYVPLSAPVTSTAPCDLVQQNPPVYREPAVTTQANVGIEIPAELLHDVLAMVENHNHDNGNSNGYGHGATNAAQWAQPGTNLPRPQSTQYPPPPTPSLPEMNMGETEADSQLDVDENTLNDAIDDVEVFINTDSEGHADENVLQWGDTASASAVKRAVAVPAERAKSRRAGNSVPAKTKRRRCDQPKSPFIWQWLLDLLLSGQHVDMVRWETRELGIFKIIKSKSLAQLWGKSRNRGDKPMTYENFSRALRYYYKRNILTQVDQRLTYQFGPQAAGWQQSS